MFLRNPSLFLGLFLSVVAVVVSKELVTVSLFPRIRIELVPNEEFSWLKQPVWSKDGSYLLMAMSKWVDEYNQSCGLMWRYNDTTGTENFWKCTDTDNAWAGEEDLLICQHGKHCSFCGKQ